MNDSLKDKEEVGLSETSLLSFPCIDLKVRVAPIPRLLNIVENIAPIPVKNRMAHFELASESINRVSITREPLDEAFYVGKFDQVDSNTLLSAQNKKARHERLRALEAVMSLNKILKLHSQATGLAKYYRRGRMELTLTDYIAVVQDNSAKTSNIIFRAIQVTLRWESLCIPFK
ncbi:hypothetical protein PsorP6_004303 [Peronosclerospora sorghi]|uniref:Uncharacterized protein n=1 Tax=Peronosclerospora sorghi TaxID=230839 RepID=A0ACC0VL26_9STRA|nr:hypothetical protein PsorP6_004303 [Peronosclerospora sorghi]